MRSDNTVFQQLDLDLGPEQVRQTAYDMGITSHLDAYPAEGLGGLRIGVSPLEMTRAYTTINTGGWRVNPVAIKKVEFPDGHVDTSLGKRKRVKVFTDGQTHEATLAMEANVQRGTGTNAQLGCPAAGKTGTTSSFTDAWFDGFTTSLNTAVWVGYPDSTQSMTAVPGYGEMFGGLAPGADLARLHVRPRWRRRSAIRSPSRRRRSCPRRSSASTRARARPAAATTRSRSRTTRAPTTRRTRRRTTRRRARRTTRRRSTSRRRSRPPSPVAAETSSSQAPVAPTGGVGVG